MIFKEVPPPEKIEWRDERCDPGKEYILIRHGREFRILNKKEYDQIRAGVVDTDSSVTALKYIKNDNVIIIGTDDGNIKVWSFDENKYLKNIRLGIETVLSIDYNPDHNLVVATTNDGAITMWKYPSWEKVNLITPSYQDAKKAIFVGDQLIFSTSTGIKIWDLSTGHASASVNISKIKPTLFAYASEQGIIKHTVAVASSDNKIMLWRIDEGALSSIKTQHRITAMDWSPSGAIITIGTENGDLVNIDIISGKPVSAVSAHTGKVISIKWSSDGSKVASGDDSGAAYVHESAGLGLIASLDGHNSAVNAIEWIYDDKTVITGSSDRTIRLWKPRVIKPLRKLRAKKQDIKITVAAWNPLFVWIGLGTSEGEVIILDLREDRITRLRAHSGPVKVFTWAPHGLFGASGGFDDKIQIINVDKKKIERTITTHQQGITALAWSPDARYLVSAGVDDTIKVWSISNGKVEAVLRGLPVAIKDLVWTPDGTHIIARYLNRRISAWRLEDPALLSKISTTAAQLVTATMKWAEEHKSDIRIKPKTCMICLQPIAPGDRIRKCPHCGAIAHADELEEWLRTHDNRCPRCRQKI